MLEVWAVPGVNKPEIRRERKKVIAGCDINGLAIKCDTAQAPVAAEAVPLDIRGIPIERLAGRLRVEVDQVQAAVTVTPAAAANYKTGDKLDYVSPNPFLNVTHTVRGRSWALIWR